MLIVGDGDLDIIEKFCMCVKVNVQRFGHMEKQEMELKWKLEMETRNGN